MDGDGLERKTSVQLKDSMTCPLSLIATMISLTKMMTRAGVGPLVGNLLTNAENPQSLPPLSL